MYLDERDHTKNAAVGIVIRLAGQEFQNRHQPNRNNDRIAFIKSTEWRNNFDTFAVYRKSLFFLLVSRYFHERNGKIVGAQFFLYIVQNSRGSLQPCKTGNYRHCSEIFKSSGHPINKFLQDYSWDALCFSDFAFAFPFRSNIFSYRTCTHWPLYLFLSSLYTVDEWGNSTFFASVVGQRIFIFIYKKVKYISILEFLLSKVTTLFFFW